MKKKQSLKYSSLLLFAMLMITACSKMSEPEDNPEPLDPIETQLILSASATDIDTGEEVTFKVIAGGKEIDADIFINNQKITGTKHIFQAAGDYEIVAKKEKYKESNKLLAAVYALDVYVSGLQNITANDVSAGQIIVWKNDKVLYELTDGTMHVTTAGITLHNDNIYVGGVQNLGFNRVAKYWKNNTPYDLTDGKGNAFVVDIAVDEDGHVYTVGEGNKAHFPVLWLNDLIYTFGPNSGNKYFRAITVSGNNRYIVGNSSSVGTTPSVAKLWLNDEEFNITNGLRSARALDVTVHGEDVYILGEENTKESNQQGGKYIAKYWKNDVETIIDEDETSITSVLEGDIAVHDGNVYVCGILHDGTTMYFRPVVWKNGKRLYELTDGASNGSVAGLAISRNHVYTVGSEVNSKGKHVIKVWKDNKVLYTLTDGTRRATASGIVLRRSK